MIPEKTPFSVGKITTFNHVRCNELHEDSYESSGGFFNEGKWSWIAQGPNLYVLDTCSGNLVSRWKFSAGPAIITCVTEYTKGNDFPILLVGLLCEHIGGMVCVFDVKRGKVIKAIQLPSKVTSVIAIDEELCKPLARIVKNMSSVVVIGLLGGEVLLVDLKMKSWDDLIKQTESNPSYLSIIDLIETNEETAVTKLLESYEDEVHVCININEHSFLPDFYYVLDPKGTVNFKMQKFKVEVTSMLYIPCAASLVTGFNYGSFQIWNLLDLRMTYLSPLMTVPMSIVHLAFQEPSDDPRNYCYLWCVRESTEDDRVPLAIMYSLYYGEKVFSPITKSYQYRELESCSFRLEMELTGDVNSPIVGGSLISCKSLVASNQKNKNLTYPDDSYSEIELCLCLFSWQVYTAEDVPPSTFMAVFDLNQWYKEQMPSRASIGIDESSSYLATFNLSTISADGNKLVLDTSIDTKSILQYHALNCLEEHYYPSSLTFESRLLLPSKIMQLKHPGSQRFLLMYLEKTGPLALLQPTSIYEHCISIGLRPALFDTLGNITEVEEQRNFLLTLALEGHMRKFLDECAVAWCTGAQSITGCTIHTLLSWGWKRALQLKSEADVLFCPMFDCSGTKIDKSTRRLISSYQKQLKYLGMFFHSILSNKSVLKTHVNVTELEQQAKALDLAATYFDLVQWLECIGMLPEFGIDSVPGEETGICLRGHKMIRVPYPFEDLKNSYNERRTSLKRISATLDHKVLLSVDMYVEKEKSLQQLWNEDGGNGLYPPPSLQSLLKMFLLEDVPLDTKLFIVMYIFLDMVVLLDNDKYAGAVDFFATFPLAFNIRTSLIKIAQALWHLDHREFEEALDVLFDSEITAHDLKEQQWAIVRAFLYQGEADLALRFMDHISLPLCDKQQINLKLSCFVHNHRIKDAYQLIKTYNNQEVHSYLLTQFLKAAEQTNQLGEVINLPLTLTEEQTFLKYMETSKHPKADDICVIYFLQRSRIMEAAEFNEQVNKRTCHSLLKKRSDPKMRDLMVDAYFRTLPPITKKVVHFCAKEKTRLQNWHIAPKPQPLSVVVRQTSNQSIKNWSTLVCETINKARETWYQPHSPVSQNFQASTCRNVQTTPFLFSGELPVTERVNTSVVYPTPAKEKSLKRKDDMEYEDFSYVQAKRSKLNVQAKRSKLNEYSPISESRKTDWINESNNYGSGSKLLSTPLVKRLSCSTPNSSFSGKPKTLFTPHSILKVRNLMRRSFSPEKRSRSKTPSVCEDNVSTTDSDPNQEDSEDNCHFQESMSRQIRFSLPPEDLPSPITSNNVSKGEFHEKKRLNYVGSTPRPAVTHNEKSGHIFEEKVIRSENTKATMRKPLGYQKISEELPRSYSSTSSFSTNINISQTDSGPESQDEPYLVETSVEHCRIPSASIVSNVNAQKTDKKLSMLVNNRQSAFSNKLPHLRKPQGRRPIHSRVSFSNEATIINSDESEELKHSTSLSRRSIKDQSLQRQQTELSEHYTASPILKQVTDVSTIKTRRILKDISVVSDGSVQSVKNETSSWSESFYNKIFESTQLSEDLDRNSTEYLVETETAPKGILDDNSDISDTSLGMSSNEIASDGSVQSVKNETSRWSESFYNKTFESSKLSEDLETETAPKRNILEDISYVSDTSLRISSNQIGTDKSSASDSSITSQNDCLEDDDNVTKQMNDDQPITKTNVIFESTDFSGNSFCSTKYSLKESISESNTLSKSVSHNDNEFLEDLEEKAKLNTLVDSTAVNTTNKDNFISDREIQVSKNVSSCADKQPKSRLHNVISGRKAIRENLANSSSTIFENIASPKVKQNERLDSHSHEKIFGGKDFVPTESFSKAQNCGIQNRKKDVKDKSSIENILDSSKAEKSVHKLSTNVGICESTIRMSSSVTVPSKGTNSQVCDNSSYSECSTSRIGEWQEKLTKDWSASNDLKLNRFVACDEEIHSSETRHFLNVGNSQSDTKAAENEPEEGIEEQTSSEVFASAHTSSQSTIDTNISKGLIESGTDLNVTKSTEISANNLRTSERDTLPSSNPAASVCNTEEEHNVLHVSDDESASTDEPIDDDDDDDDMYEEEEVEEEEEDDDDDEEEEDNSSSASSTEEITEQNKIVEITAIDTEEDSEADETDSESPCDCISPEKNNVLEVEEMTGVKHLHETSKVCSDPIVVKHSKTSENIVQSETSSQKMEEEENFNADENIETSGDDTEKVIETPEEVAIESVTGASNISKRKETDKPKVTHTHTLRSQDQKKNSSSEKESDSKVTKDEAHDSTERKNRRKSRTSVRAESEERQPYNIHNLRKRSSSSSNLQEKNTKILSSPIHKTHSSTLKKSRRKSKSLTRAKSEERPTDKLHNLRRRSVSSSKLLDSSTILAPPKLSTIKEVDETATDRSQDVTTSVLSKFDNSKCDTSLLVMSSRSHRTISEEPEISQIPKDRKRSRSLQSDASVNIESDKPMSYSPVEEKEASGDVSDIEYYETERRLTRGQRAIIAKSMEFAKKFQASKKLYPSTPSSSLPDANIDVERSPTNSQASTVLRESPTGLSETSSVRRSTRLQSRERHRTPTPSETSSVKELNWSPSSTKSEDVIGQRRKVLRNMSRRSIFSPAKSLASTSPPNKIPTIKNVRKRLRLAQSDTEVHLISGVRKQPDDDDAASSTGSCISRVSSHSTYSLRSSKLAPLREEVDAGDALLETISENEVSAPTKKRKLGRNESSIQEVKSKPKSSTLRPSSRQSRKVKINPQKARTGK